MTSSSTSASPISCAPSKNSVTSRYSRSGVISTMPYGAAVGMPTSRSSRSRVVLVLDEPAHRLERRFVLEPPVEDGAPELVPAVGPHVVHRVELAEQVRVGIARDPQPQRCRSARAFEPDRLDVEDREAELVLHRVPDRLAARPPTSRCAVLPAAVRDREHLVRREEAERVERDTRWRAATPTTMSNGWYVAEVQLRAREHDAPTTTADRPCAIVARPPGDDASCTRCRRATTRHDRDRCGREREALPPADDRHVVRARPGEPLRRRCSPTSSSTTMAADEGEEVAPAPEHHERDEQRDRDHGHRPPGSRAGRSVDATSVSHSVRTSGDLAEDRRRRPGRSSRRAGRRVVARRCPRTRSTIEDEPALAGRRRCCAAAAAPRPTGGAGGGACDRRRRIAADRRRRRSGVGGVGGRLDVVTAEPSTRQPVRSRPSPDRLAARDLRVQSRAASRWSVVSTPRRARRRSAARSGRRRRCARAA